MRKPNDLILKYSRPLLALSALCAFSLEFMQPALAETKHKIETGLHFLNVKASTADISAKPAILHLSVSQGKLIRGLLASASVEFETDKWDSKEEENAWSLWSRVFQQKLFESWLGRSQLPGQVTLRLVIDSERKVIVEEWGTMFAGANPRRTNDSTPTMNESPITRDQFMAEAQECVDNLDKAWLKTHNFPKTQSKLKVVRMDITLGNDGEQFPRHSPLEFGALVRIRKDGSLLVECMRGITVSNVQCSHGFTLKSGCTKEQLKNAIADKSAVFVPAPAPEKHKSK